MNRRAALRSIAALAVALMVGLGARVAWGDFSSTPLGPLTPPFGNAASPPGASAAPQTPHPAVARIIVPEKDGTSFGSGTLIGVTDSQGLVITNNHVIESQAGPITVVFPDGFRSEATVLKRDETWDLAALAIWKPNVAPVSIAAARAVPGETLAIAGYGSGAYRMAMGRCTQYVAPGPKQPFEMVELAASARQGDSGGPILNQRGELAGVLFGEGDGKTAGSDAGRVNWFLASIRGAESPSLARLTANRTGTDAAPNGAAPDAWRAADPLPGPAGSSFAGGPKTGSINGETSPANPFAGRIAPSNTSPSVPSIDPRYAQPIAQPGGANGQANGGSRWAWPGARGDVALPAASGATSSHTAALAQSHDTRPSYPLPDSTATSPTSPAAATKTTGESDMGTLLGATRFEQAKSILAIIGAIAIVVTFAKGFSKA
jgi:hypothetical protein